MKNISRIKSVAENKKQNSSHGTAIKGINSQKGFTLIEVIATLVIVGIMAALGGLGIVQAVKGYITVKQNSETTQKFQMALTRINREIREMINTPTATATTISMTGVNNCFSNTNCVRTIGLDNGAIKITSGGDNLANGDILIDNVHSFNISYYKEGDTPWTSADDQILLAGVKVDMSINLPGGGTLGGVGGGLLPSNIAPRNNGNLGGLAPPTWTAATLPPPRQWGCFVATAAYGNPWHPMVQVLRDFRNRHLVNWPGGKWFIKQYYAHGPAAADMIRNRPIAMFAVRCLLAPATALIFCLMYAPLVIPFVLIVSLFVTTAVFAAFRRKLTISSGILRSRGSILIGLIFTMVIMAVLAAAMLPMFSSSYMNQFYTDQGRKAYFLAESGFAYAALRYRDADTEAARETALADMQGKAYSLDDAGKFTNRFYPHWFKITAVGTDISAQVPAGEVPPKFGSLTSTKGNMRVCTGGENSTCNGIYSYNGVTVTSTTINFTDVSKISGSSAVVGSYVLPSALPQNQNYVVTKGSDLTLKNNTGADAFPEYNGTFTIDPSPSGITAGLVFRYQKKVGRELQNITLADPRKVWENFTVGNNNIVLNKFLVLSSTGQTLGGFSREVIYNTPVGDSSGSWVKAQFLDKNMEGFVTAADQSIGTHSVSEGKMQVTNVVNPQTITGSIAVTWIGNFIKSFLQAFYLIDHYPGVWAIAAWDWTNTETNLAQGFSDAGGALSYDIQVKIDASTKKYFSNGIGFRLRGNDDETDIFGYGVSIIRQRQTRCCIWAVLGNICSSWGGTIGGSCLESNGAQPMNDGIDGDLRPLTSYPGQENNIWTNGTGLAWQDAQYSDPAIVLWQRTNAGFNVLAYRIIQPEDGLMNGNWKDTSAANYVTPQNLRLKPWVTLMVRVIEGYELTFSSGKVDTNGIHLKYGNTVQIRDGSGNVKAIARVMGTPVMLTAWGSNDTTSGSGTLMLTNLTANDIASGDYIYMNGSAYATATSSITDSSKKTNHIMVYYSDNKTPPATGDNIQANNTRIGNVLYTTEIQANWPPDDQTDRSAANDYFTLVKWQSVTPSGALTLNWTYGCGWQSGGIGVLERVACTGPEMAPALSSGWALQKRSNGWPISTTTGWEYQDSKLHKLGNILSADNSDQTATYTYGSGGLPAGDYKVSVTLDSRQRGYGYLVLGGTTLGSPFNNMNDTRTYGPVDVSIGNSGTIVFHAGNSWPYSIGNADFRISGLSIKPNIDVATASAPVNLVAGVSYKVSVGATTLDSGEGFKYIIDGNEKICNTSGAACDLTFTSSTNGATNLVFYPYPNSGNASHRFTIGSIAVTPQQDVLNNTWASLVPVADKTADFYNAVVKTGALVSPDGSTYTDFMDGGADIIALMTASYAGAGTFYDDFAVQMDTKSSPAFLPPIQQ